MSDRLTSLPEIEAACWRELDNAARDKGHAWRAPVLATTDGRAADARTVILREVDAERHELFCFSDSRAGKIAQLSAHPEGTLVMWSPTLAWQLRCRVHLRAETEGLAVASRWARVKLSPAAQDYLSPLAPGADAETAPATETLEHFAVITARVLSIDWLELAPDGHRRARFASGSARWLQP